MKLEICTEDLQDTALCERIAYFLAPNLRGKAAQLPASIEPISEHAQCRCFVHVFTPEEIAEAAKVQTDADARVAFVDAESAGFTAAPSWPFPISTDDVEILPPAHSAPPPATNEGSIAQGAELDSSGLPWDGRIHAGTKRRNADGTWGRKRGVEDAEYQRVVDQLRLLLTPAAVPVPPAPAASNPNVMQTIMSWTETYIKSERLGFDAISKIVTDVGVQAGVPDLQISQLRNRPDLVPAIDAALRVAAGV